MPSFRVTDITTLARALKTVTPLINPKQPIPAITGVLLEASLRGVTVTTSNLEQILSKTIHNPGIIDNIEGAEEGEGKISFIITQKTASAIQQLPPGVYDFEFNPEENKVKILGNKSRQSHTVMPAEDFIDKPEVEGTPFKIDNCGELRRVSFAVSSKIHQTVYTGVLFDFAKKKIAGTDVHRLAVLEMQGNIPEGLPNEIILPLPAVNVAQNMDNPTVTVTDTQVKFEAKGETEDTELISRTIKGQWGSYTRVIPEKEKCTAVVTFNADEFRGAVERASIYGGIENNSPQVTILFNNGNIVVSGQAREGEIDEEVSYQLESGTVPEFPVIMNSKYVLDALKHVNSEEISWWLQGAKLPALMRAKDSEDWCCVIVPITPVNEV